MKKIIGFTFLGLLTSGVWASSFHYNECVEHSREFCTKHNNTPRACKVTPEIWCKKDENIKTAKKDHDKLQAVKSKLPKSGKNLLGR